MASRLGDDFEQRRFAERVELHVGRAGHVFQNFARFARNFFDLGEVLAENFHRDVGARAFEDFVEPHLDGLAEQIGLRRERALPSSAVMQVGELVLGDGLAVDFAPFAQAA